MNQDAIVKKARSLLGVKYRHQGRCCKGIDCAGHIYACWIAGGMNPDNFPPLPVYKKAPKDTDVRAWLGWYTYPVLYKDRQAGDTALMKYHGKATHTGIYTGDSIIHAAAFARKVVEEPIENIINSCVCGFFRLKEN